MVAEIYPRMTSLIKNSKWRRDLLKGCIAGREKVGRWNEQSALQAMCDAEKDWHERSFRASGAFGGRQNLPFNKPEISFSFFIFQPAVHYD